MKPWPDCAPCRLPSDAASSRPLSSSASQSEVSSTRAGWNRSVFPAASGLSMGASTPLSVMPSGLPAVLPTQTPPGTSLPQTLLSFSSAMMTRFGGFGLREVIDPTAAT